MNVFTHFLRFLRGNDTVRELFRLGTIGLLTALLALGISYFFRRKQPVPVVSDTTLIQATLKAQHRFDSVQALLVQWQQQRRIDSLTSLLRKHDELDSMRAHAGLSTLQTMQRINGAIRR